ncbi:hypothetical protein B0H13DRAFT_2668684 [Mycena leptocephala]|nr:hypothetical protein B0H13DRAFT_2668684 [Mycena leptocephala]
MPITLRPYTNSDADFDFLFAAFNSCIEWLAAKGLQDQWPWGADVKQRLRANIPEDAKGARRWIAELDGEPAGYLEITPFRSEYLPVVESEEKPGTEILRLPLAAFNSCVEWLAAKGLEDQWGAQPWGDDVKQRLRAKIPVEDAKGARRWIAELDGEPAGYLDITPSAPNASGAQSFVGRGVGGILLGFAKGLAVEERPEWLRLDCWRGPAGKDGLVRYYEGNGFVRARAFVIPPKAEDKKEWPGQMFEIKVSDLE